MIDVTRLTYRYPNGVVALDDVTFSVRAGETVAVVGPSGAGKSTLLLHLNGLLPEVLSTESHPPAVRIAGRAVEKQHLAEIRRMVGLVFQDPDDQLFCPTVREDVAFGPLNLGLTAGEVEERITESLAAVGMTDCLLRSTLELSVGERKRVCLAGVLACRPDVLALDEPSSNLDPRARRALLQILRNFPGSQIVATHDLDLVVEHCERVIVLDSGRIHADGCPREVLSDARLMERHGLEVPLRLRLPHSASDVRAG